MSHRCATVRRRLLATTVTLALAPGLLAVGSATAQETDRYVALGDSFSSGTGTRDKVDDCYRSPHGYPQLVADAEGLDLDYQACQGAVIEDVRAQQLSALSSETDLVTMTIGGNDLGYADVITQCALPGWLSRCDALIDEALTELHTSLPGRYDTLLGEISDLAPSADVRIAGYPRMFNGTDCNAGTFFSEAEMIRLNDAADQLSGVIADRTAAAGFTYVDVIEAFDGHAVCDDPEWINGLSWPIEESYHPNRAGNTAYAALIRGQAAPDTSATTSGSAAGSAAPTTGSELRAEADAVLAMHLDSPENLDTARAQGVPPGEIVRLVAQLRSGNEEVVRAALDGLTELDREHSLRRGH